MMMGVWFLASSVSHLVAGLIAGMATVSGGEAAAGTASLVIYTETFEFVTQVAVLVGVLVIVVSPIVRRFMHETR